MTIGRGYDLKHRTKQEVRAHCEAAGIKRKKMLILLDAVRLEGAAAEQYVVDNKEAFGRISREQQQALFGITYDLEHAEVVRISHKADVVELYGKLDFDTVCPDILDILVDLKFRGDYVASSRRKIQKHAVNNDIEEFAKQISRQANWSNVPEDRFRRRRRFINGSDDADACPVSD